MITESSEMYEIMISLGGSIPKAEIDTVSVKYREMWRKLKDFTNNGVFMFIKIMKVYNEVRSGNSAVK